MRNMKVASIFLTCLLTFSTLAGCGSSSTNNVNGGEKGFKISMVTDEGGIGDKSFNDATHEGILKAGKELNFTSQVIQPQRDSEFESYLDKASKSSDLVFAVGYKLRNALEKVSKQNMKSKHVLIDDEVSGDNVLNLTFKDEEGSFLAGIVAGLMTKTNKVGFIGGIETTVIERFRSGFIAGVKSVNLEAGKLLEDGVTSRYAGSFSDTAKGYEIGKSLYNDGVDIIYHAAGGVGIGMFRAAQESKKLAIGTDQDQAANLPEYSENILTSVVKNLSDSVYNVIKDFSNGKFEAGTLRLGIKDNGVYLTNSNGKIPQNILEKVEEYKQKIANGEIVVPKNSDEVKNFKM